MPKAQPQTLPTSNRQPIRVKRQLHDPPANPFTGHGPLANPNGTMPRFADPKIRQELIEAMRLGLAHHKVAAICGVTIDTLRRWFDESYVMVRLYDQMVFENGGVQPQLTRNQELYLQLGLDLKRAEANSEQRCLQVIRDCAIGQDATHEQVDTFDGKGALVYSKKFRKERGKNWAAAAWWLERRHPEEYGKKRMLAEGELPPGIDLETLRLAALLKQLPKVELEQVRQVVKSALTPRLANPCIIDPNNQTTGQSPVVQPGCSEPSRHFPTYDDQANPAQVNEPIAYNQPGWPEPGKFPCCEHPSEIGNQPSQDLDSGMVMPTANVIEADNPAPGTQLGEIVSSMGNERVKSGTRPAELITRAKPATTLTPRQPNRSQPFAFTKSTKAKPQPSFEKPSSLGSRIQSGSSSQTDTIQPKLGGTKLDSSVQEINRQAELDSAPIQRVRRKP